ncbi:MAG TPA: cytochrome c oxidase subunit 3 [Candidatus Dormibacteraeota bacterium]|nr:cytochrome c oxidase subunit 3 [Candidatus Dormibacteraeota bacterium]
MAEVTGGYHEPAATRQRNLWVGVRLWIAAEAFFFVCFVFAFFYLRELDNNHMWRDRHANPPVLLGSVILVGVLLATVAGWVGVRALRRGREGWWRGAMVLALLLGLAAVVLQCVEWPHLGFLPTDGAYASVFLGWTGFYLLFLLGALYWLEIVLVQAVRGQTDGGPIVVVGDAQAATLHLGFLAVVGIVAYLLLYLVA